MIYPTYLVIEVDLLDLPDLPFRLTLIVFDLPFLAYLTYLVNIFGLLFALPDLPCKHFG